MSSFVTPGRVICEQLAKAGRQASDVPYFKEFFGTMNGILLGVKREYPLAFVFVIMYYSKIIAFSSLVSV